MGAAAQPEHLLLLAVAVPEEVPEEEPEVRLVLREEAPEGVPAGAESLGVGAERADLQGGAEGRGGEGRARWGMAAQPMWLVCI